MSRSVCAIAAVALGIAACDSTGPENGARLAIRFSTIPAASGASLGVQSATADLVVDGANGSLDITDIHFIVDEFELERQDDACEASSTSGMTGSASRDDDDDDDDDDECEEFEAGPFFVGLALGSEVSIVSQDVPAGTYTRLKFKVEDRDFDDDDDDDHHNAGTEQDVLQAILDAGFTDWPERASMVVIGTFTPAGETPRPFTTYFKAELKIKQRFDPPMTVSDEATTIDVEIDPSLWFRTSNGNVLDLSAFDFATTQRVVEFEAKMGDGFHHTRHDHD